MLCRWTSGKVWVDSGSELSSLKPALALTSRSRSGCNSCVSPDCLVRQPNLSELTYVTVLAWSRTVGAWEKAE